MDCVPPREELPLLELLPLELDELEQVAIADVNLGTARRFRREFWDRFGFQRVR
jgi:hypothetical protein